MEKPIKIALCGIGTVGKGVLELFNKNMALIRQRIGKDIQIVKALEKDPEKIKTSGLTSGQVSDSLDFILEDPEIDIVIELIGGDTIAKEIILKALDNGKSVVTANKALLAEHSDVIFPATYAAKGFFGFEASVAGGIPVLRNLREGFTGDEISEVSGIINGTANYILSSMT
ncbi:MAG: homoserine dehydrogenase, partial [Deltaproteobacteria bacterium]|nr:homoserine dehydrogenase [Deltaproteobacteria bacterium]